MKKNTSKPKQMFKRCSICNKPIKGFSKSQVEYNLKLHLEAHTIKDAINAQSIEIEKEKQDLKQSPVFPQTQDKENKNG